jgi:hypothetical protein
MSEGGRGPASALLPVKMLTAAAANDATNTHDTHSVT